MPSGPRTRASRAADAWRLMFDYMIRSGPRRTESLARRGLTPNDSRALFSLAREEGRTMRSLADAWRCDPSNATWIVDRLERLGFAERRSVPDDRRVKLVVLTAKGETTRNDLLQEFHEPPPELAALDDGELDDLLRILRKLLPAPHPGETPLAPQPRSRVRQARPRRRAPAR